MIRLDCELQSQQEDEDRSGGVRLKIAFGFGKLETYSEVKTVVASMVSKEKVSLCSLEVLSSTCLVSVYLDMNKIEISFRWANHVPASL